VKSNKVFVTGGAGFIGSSLVRQLVSSGYYVTIYDNLSSGIRENLPKENGIRLISGDVRDSEMLTTVMKGHDYVLHLAAQAFIPMSYQLPVNMAETNAVGSLNVFKACLDNQIKRVVHVSSSEVYGSAVYTPMDEQHPTTPESTYAVAKLAADLWAQTMHFEHNIPIVILRPFNTFGPRDSLPRFIPEMIRQCLKEESIKVGDINTGRDYTYVDDTVRAIVLAMETENIEGEIINIGTGKTFKMSRILQMIKRATGNGEKPVVEDSTRLRPKDVTSLMSSKAKAQRLMSWKPEVEFEQGLKKTIEWYMNNGHAWTYEKCGWHWRY